MLRRVATIWNGMSLAQRVGAATLIGHACLVAASGNWLSNRIGDSVLMSNARSNAILMESVIGTHVQDLARQHELSAQSKAKLNELLSHAPLKGNIVELRLWRRDGSNIFDSEGEDEKLIPPVIDEIERAFSGDLAVELNDAHHDQAGLERKHNVPLFEINAPIHESGADRVLAVAEFFQAAEKLHADLKKARLQSWLVVGSLALALLMPLFPIIRKASRTIDEQSRTLAEQQVAQNHLAEQNTSLRGSVLQAHRRGAEINERSMRRIGADLHDGPAQLVGLALLKLDELAPALKSASEGSARLTETHALIRQALTDALREIRNVASGLALPELERVSLAAALDLAARAHEQRTRTVVDTQIGSLPAHLPLSTTICLFRFAQEGLNNAFRHAGGKGQTLRAHSLNGSVFVEVSDNGTGFDVNELPRRKDKLGLSGLRNRVESLGGTLEVHSVPGGGTTLRAIFRDVASEVQLPARTS